MPKIYLKYGLWNNGVLVWSDPIEYNALEVYEIPNTTHIAARDLCQNENRIILSKRSVWKVTISADELVYEDKFNNLKAFYTAHAWKISVEAQFSDTVLGYEVVMSDGDMPTEFINNHKRLREAKFVFTQKYPDTSNG